MILAYKNWRAWILQLIVLFLVIMPVISYAAKAPEPQPGPAELKKTDEAPVIFNDKVLFNVNSKILSLSPESRAKMISQRIDKLSKDILVKTDSIIVSDAENTTDITAGDRIIMTVTEDDAAAADKQRIELAREYASMIKSAMDEQRKAYSTKAVIYGAIYALAATLALILILFLVKKVSSNVY